MVWHKIHRIIAKKVEEIRKNCCPYSRSHISIKNEPIYLLNIPFKSEHLARKWHQIRRKWYYEFLSDKLCRTKMYRTQIVTKPQKGKRKEGKKNWLFTNLKEKKWQKNGKNAKCRKSLTKETEGKVIFVAKRIKEEEEENGTCGFDAEIYCWHFWQNKSFCEENDVFLQQFNHLAHFPPIQFCAFRFSASLSVEKEGKKWWKVENGRK